MQDMADGRPSGGPRRLTSDRAYKRWPAWSLDGLWLAYTVEDVGKPAEVAVMPADGRLSPRVITSGAQALARALAPAECALGGGDVGRQPIHTARDSPRTAPRPRSCRARCPRHRLQRRPVRREPDGRRVVFSRKSAPSGVSLPHRGQLSALLTVRCVLMPSRAGEECAHGRTGETGVGRYSAATSPTVDSVQGASRETTTYVPIHVKPFRYSADGRFRLQHHEVRRRRRPRGCRQRQARHRAARADSCALQIGA